jgi:hypothetical protein
VCINHPFFFCCCALLRCAGSHSLSNYWIAVQHKRIMIPHSAGSLYVYVCIHVEWVSIDNGNVWSIVFLNPLASRNQGGKNKQLLLYFYVLTRQLTQIRNVNARKWIYMLYKPAVIVYIFKRLDHYYVFAEITKLCCHQG